MADPTSHAAPNARGADYGLDAPGLVKTFAALGLGLVVIGAIFMSLRAGTNLAVVGRIVAWVGGSWTITALLMWLSSRYGKLRARDRLLDRLAFRGDETVLDVGCGHGLLLLGAARRLTRGRAIGVDLWSQKDQAANSKEATLANASIEGVRDRVEVRDGDMRQLPFGDASVDVVVSSLAIHNVSSARERAIAVGEIARVLVPSGRVGILDIAHVGDYARVLREHGFVIDRLALVPTIFPPTRELVAHKR